MANLIRTEFFSSAQLRWSHSQLGIQDVITGQYFSQKEQALFCKNKM